MTHNEARQILTEAWRQVWGRSPTDRELLYSAAIAFLETGYGRAGQFGQLAARGQYNWGALERRPSADGTCPPGTAPGGDQGAVCFYVFPSDVAAASAFLKTLTKKHWPVVEAMRGTPEDVATAMRVFPPYYTGYANTESQKVADYAKAIRNAITAAGQDVPTGKESSSGSALLLAGLLFAGYALYRKYAPDSVRRTKTA